MGKNLKAPVPYRTLLGLLTSIFALRIVLQFWQWHQPLDFLPPFELWHSETVPYRILLGMQLVMLAAMATTAYAAPFRVARPRLGRALIGLGWIYIGIMIFRLVVGASGLSQYFWFDAAVPTAFHFGLAAYVLVLGSAVRGNWRHKTARRNPSLPRYAAYPALLVGSYVLFVWMRETGSPLLFSSYLSVLVGGFGVLLHETFAPAREDWRPDQSEVLNDGLFLTLVQILLPTLLKALALALIVALAKSDLAPLAFAWPHRMPVLIQIMAMLVIAEFFRYWLHRALHEHMALWKLHAVHHAPDKLYTVNVGRFHPLDKAIQFLGDSLPFLLLGVSAEVFAAYFVLYALNGFYQHSNADVRLGPLNWVIAGPELHRWHHSAKISEANSNYGNNLIIWDTVFGTRFLPKDREVDSIGIGNKDWPNGFLAQMTAPFTTPTEAPDRRPEA